MFRSFGLAVSKGTRPRNRGASESSSVTTTFDEFGSLPQVKYAYQGIARSRQIVAFRRQNSTVVAYALPSSDSLQQSLGCKPLYILVAPQSGDNVCHHILLTGIAGDCRTIVRHMKQVVLNHTMEFDTAPTGSYLASKLGALMQSHTSGGGRLLAAHCFLISTPAWGIARASDTAASSPGEKPQPAHNSCGSGTIYEVSATGSVSQVQGGTAGAKHMQRARQLLEDRYNSSSEWTVESCKALCADLFNATLGVLDGDKEDGGVNTEVESYANTSFYFLEIPDAASTVHF